MALVNCYATVADVGARLQLDSVDALVKPCEQAITLASRAIDDWCDRRFYVDDTATVRVVAASDCTDLDVADIATASGLIVAIDANSDGTFETTVAGTSFQLEPLNQVAGPIENHAYTRLVAFPPTQWPIDPQGRALVRITATWGWPAVPAVVHTLCVELAARALLGPVGVKSESIGGYRVDYQQVGAVDLTDGDKALLEPFQCSKDRA